MSRCRSCQAEIRWARTAAGRSIPLDLEPRADGNVTLNADGVAIVFGSARVMPADAGPRYVSHFTTCPEAGEHRRTR